MKTPRQIANRIFLGLAAFILALALFLLAFPSTILNTSTLAYAMRRFGRDYRPSASELSLRVSSPGLLTKRFSLRARDLCFDEFHGAAKGCFRVLELEAVVRVGAGPLLSVSTLERLVVHAGELRFDSTAAPLAPAKRRREKSSPGLVPAWAARMTLGAVDVRIPRALLISTGGVTTAGLAAAFLSTSTAPLRAEAFAVLKGTGPEPGRRWDADLKLDTDLFREGRLTSLDATATARGDGGLSAAAVLKLAPRDGGVRGAFDAFVASAQGKLSLAALEGCGIEANRSKKSGRFERPDVDCRITLQPAPFGGRGPKPKALTGTASLHGGKAAVRLGPMKGYGGFALDGTVEADARLTGGGDRPRVLEFSARTDLASPKQALIASVKGRVEKQPAGKRRGLKVQAAVDLERVVLRLPRLELKMAPAPVVDKRVGMVDYDATVRTSTPMILTTNLVKPAVPVSLDLRARPEGLSGSMRFEGFDAEAFQRGAKIGHITLTTRPKGAASLYLYASTPADSVVYDAATRSYRVELKPPDGATLSIGAAKTARR